jgi:hypothetical protein
MYAKARDRRYKVDPYDTYRDEFINRDLYVRIVGSSSLIMTSVVTPICPTVRILWETFR